MFQGRSTAALKLMRMRGNKTRGSFQKEPPTDINIIIECFRSYQINLWLAG